jgi:hypothetical protein
MSHVDHSWHWLEQRRSMTRRRLIFWMQIVTEPGSAPHANQRHRQSWKTPKAVELARFTRGDSFNHRRLLDRPDMSKTLVNARIGRRVRISSKVD